MEKVNQKTAQQIVDTVKDVCGQDINFIDLDGKIYASTNKARIGKFHEIGQQVALTGTTIEVGEDNTFFGTHAGVNLPVLHGGELVGVIGISGEPEKVRKFAYLAEKITLLLLREQELAFRYHTQKSHINYILRLLLQEETACHKKVNDYIADQAILADAAYQVILVTLDSRYNPSNLGMIENAIFDTFRKFSSELYTFNYPNEYILILESAKLKTFYYILERFLEKNGNLLKISIGSPYKLHQQYRSYEEARLTSRCSAIGTLTSYQELGIEILCSGADKDTVPVYIGKFLQALDEEEINLLKVYYENDMSLAKTADDLFLHKNTIQYKLDRIAQKCGFNPRRFRDAAGFYSAILLKNLCCPSA